MKGIDAPHEEEPGSGEEAAAHQGGEPGRSIEVSTNKEEERKLDREGKGVPHEEGAYPRDEPEGSKWSTKKSNCSKMRGQ